MLTPSCRFAKVPSLLVELGQLQLQTPIPRLIRQEITDDHNFRTQLDQFFTALEMDRGSFRLLSLLQRLSSLAVNSILQFKVRLIAATLYGEFQTTRRPCTVFGREWSRCWS